MVTAFGEQVEMCRYWDSAYELLFVLNRRMLSLFLLTPSKCDEKKCLTFNCKSVN